MYSSKRFAELILYSVDITKLMSWKTSPRIQDIFPAEGFCYFRLNERQLLGQFGQFPLFNNVQIKGARLFCYDQTFAIYLKLQTGERILMPLHLNNELIKMFKMQNNFFDLYLRKTDPIREWNLISSSTFYSKDTHKHYECLHTTIQDALKKLIIREINENDKLVCFNIIDGGCGDEGGLLKKLATELSEDLKKSHPHIQLRLFGFDFNADNIAKCRKEFEKLETISSSDCLVKCRFEVGDLTKTAEVIQRLSQVNETIPNGDIVVASVMKTILILSGSLTRMVLKSHQALLCLQGAAKAEVDYIIGGGLGEPIINHYIAKQTGLRPFYIYPTMHMKHTDENTPDIKFFSYYRISLEELIRIKLTNIYQKNKLDLSLSAQPDLILEVILSKIIEGRLTIKSNFMIDLSFASVNAKCIDILKVLSIRFPNIKVIMAHHDLLLIKRLEHELDRKCLETKLQLDDTYLMSSRRFFDIAAPIEILKQLTSAISNSQLTDREKYFFWSAKDENGNTPAHLALNYLKILPLLLQIKEIDWNSENKKHEIVALQLIQYIVCVKSLPKHIYCGDMQEDLEMENHERKQQLAELKMCLKLLVENGADLNKVFLYAKQDNEIIKIASKFLLYTPARLNTTTNSNANNTVQVNMQRCQ